MKNGLKRFALCLMMISAAATVSGCETIRVNVCEPISPSARDIVTRETMEQIVNHNEGLE